MTAVLVSRVVRLHGSAAQVRSLMAGGFTPCSTRDYPGARAAVVYVQGCPWHCSYCHNPHLQPALPYSPLAWSRLLRHLDDQVGSIDAVLFSGGEPTIDPALPDAIADVRALGLRTGLHTAGAEPERLASVLPLLDWVALDIKAPLARYDELTGCHGSAQAVRASARAILESAVTHEFRTTIHPSLLSEADLAALAQDLAALGANNLTLQAFRPQGCRNKALRTAQVDDYPSPSLLQHLGSMFPRFSFQR